MSVVDEARRRLAEGIVDEPWYVVEAKRRIDAEARAARIATQERDPHSGRTVTAKNLAVPAKVSAGAVQAGVRKTRVPETKTLIHLPLDSKYWNDLRVRYPYVDLDLELTKAQEWSEDVGRRHKSPRSFFRNWVAKAKSSTYELGDGNGSG